VTVNSRRQKVTGSLKMNIPTRTVPTAPIPILQLIWLFETIGKSDFA